MVVKISIIGYRNHAKVLLNLIEKRNDCKIDFIYHPTKVISDKRSTKNISDLFNSDAIVIASPNHTHKNYIQKLENFEGYVFCEKPPVVSKEELKYLKNLPLKFKQKIFFNFNFRFSHLSEKIKNLLNSKEIGKIIHINIISSQGLAFKKEYKNSWRSDGKNNLHNILDTVTIHYIDMLNTFFGEIENLSYNPTLISGNGTSYDTCNLFLQYQNQTTSSILNSYAAPFVNEISIIGTDGFFTIRDNQLSVFSPRDTFDSKGFFKFPEKSRLENFSMTESYQNSLEKSLDFFISKIISNTNIPIEQFETSILTNDLILNIKK